MMAPVDGTKLGGPVVADDPGWRPALTQAALTMIPGWGVVRGRQRASGPGADGLTAIRSLLLVFAVSLPLIGVVVALQAGEDNPASLSGEAGALLVSLVGVATIVLSRVVPRPLDCRSEAALAASYRTRFFVRVAFAQAAALCGLATFFVTTNPAMYPLGVAFAAVGYLTFVPTAARLESEQQELALSAGRDR